MSTDKPSRPDLAPGAWWAPTLCLAAVAWGGNQFTPLLAAFQAGRDLSVLQVNTLLAAYVIGIVPGLITASGLVRRAGHRPLMLAGVALSLVASVFMVVGTHLFAALFVGRVLTGLGLGWGMVAGGGWMLSIGVGAQWPGGAAALRSALSLTAGFGLGPTLTGIWGQFGPDPLRWSFLPHLGLSILALVVGPRIGHGAFDGRGRPTETPDGPRRSATFWQIAGVAPWIFGSLGLAYAVFPQQIYDQLGSLRTLFLAIVCLTALGSGFVTQRLIARWTVPGLSTSRVGLAIVVIVATTAALGFRWWNPVLVWLAALCLGVAYGLILIGCLAHIERTLPRTHLAMATALTYCLAYLGFGTPVITSWLHQRGLDYPTMLGGIAVIATTFWLLTQLISRLIHHQSKELS